VRIDITNEPAYDNIVRTRIEQLNRFKDGFPEQLDSFVERRTGEIGNPGDWKVRFQAITSEHLQVVFQHKIDRTRTISFVASGIPEDLSVDEEVGLRLYVNEICAQRGIEPHRPHMSRLGSDLMDRVRTGDSEAWATFARKHARKFDELARRLLDRDKLPSLLDGEDIVNNAMFKILCSARSHKRQTSTSPEPLIRRAIYREVINHSRSPVKLRRESAGGDDYEWLEGRPEYDERLEIMERQLPIILAKAKTLMTPRQREVLDAIVANENEGGSLELGELAEKKLHISKARVYQHLDKIAEIIHEAARASGCEETAAVIDRLVRANSRASSTQIG